MGAFPFVSSTSPFVAGTLPFVVAASPFAVGAFPFVGRALIVVSLAFPFDLGTFPLVGWALVSTSKAACSVAKALRCVSWSRLWLSFPLPGISVRPLLPFGAFPGPGRARRGPVNSPDNG